MRRQLLVTMLALLITVMAEHAPPSTSPTLHCVDWKGLIIKEGEKYFPRREEACLQCTCNQGYSVMCNNVQCLPPDCPLTQQVEGECCEFHCISLPGEPNDLDPLGNNTYPDPGPGFIKSSDLGLRLVASTVTSLLILALLLFMIHRLRQRRLLIMMRRLNTEAPDEDAVAYMTQLDQVDIEVPPYEGPPPPYSPPKPPHIPDGEPPPPYEEIQGEGHTNDGADTSQCERPGEGGGCDSTADDRHLAADVTPNSPDVIPLEEMGGGEGACVRPEDGSSNPRYDEGESPPNRRTSENYGLSVAVTGAGSPSHVVVRMHNNSPRTAILRPLTRTPKDGGNTPCDDSASGLRRDEFESRRSLPARRSFPADSRRRIGGSPKNSSGHFGESESSETDYNANPSFSTFGLPSGCTMPRHSPSGSSKNTTAIRNGPSKPFRIKDFAACHNDRDCLDRRPASLLHEAGVTLEGMQNQSPLQVGTNLKEVCSSHGADVEEAAALPPHTSTSCVQTIQLSKCANDRLNRGSNATTPNSKLLLSPVHTPLSPVGNIFLRAGSVGSGLSLVSVCSETGERKGQKPAVALNPCPGVSRSPLSPPHSAGNTSSQECPGTGATDESATTYSMGDPHSASRGTTSQSANGGYIPMYSNAPTGSCKPKPDGPNHKMFPKIVYCDAEEIAVSDSTSRSSASMKSSLNEESLSETISSPLTLNGSASESACVANQGGSWEIGGACLRNDSDRCPTKDRPQRSPATARDKRKKRRSQPEIPDKNLADGASRGNSLPSSSANSKDCESHFKQYGFIDGPDILDATQMAECCDPTRNGVGGHPVLHQGQPRRPGSKERPLSGKAHSRENSGERSRSAEGRRSKSTSKKSPEHQRMKRRSHNLPRQVDNCENDRRLAEMPVNGISGANRTRSRNKSKSPKRRQSTQETDREILDNAVAVVEQIGRTRNLDNVDFLTSSFHQTGPRPMSRVVSGISSNTDRSSQVLDNICYSLDR